MLPIRIGSAEKLMQSDFAGSDRECDVDFLPYLCRGRGAGPVGTASGVQTILEESKVSERPVATIEHNALAQAHIHSSALIVAATLLLSSHLAFAQDTSLASVCSRTRRTVSSVMASMVTVAAIRARQAEPPISTRLISIAIS